MRVTVFGIGYVGLVQAAVLAEMGHKVICVDVDADKVAALGRELYKRLSVMGGHAVAVGRALDTAVGKYNQFVGSLESQVMVAARRFEDLQVDHEGKTLPELAPVETAPRAVSRPELIAPVAES